MSTEAPANPRETENENPDETVKEDAENEPQADTQNEQPERDAEGEEKPTKDEDDKDKEEKIPSEPEMTEEEKKDLEDRTKEQKAADRRNLKRDRKCNCSKATCKMCCKRTWTAIAFILMMLLITGAFFAIMFIILLTLLKMGNQFMVQDILYMEGPAGSVVSPTLHCKINGTEHRCKRYPLGGVAAKCDCTQQIMAEDLWVELKNQKQYAESLKPQSFNKSTNDYQTAKDNIYNMISNCSGNVSLDDPQKMMQIISNNHHCFLIGFNNIINWIPEAEMRFDVYPVQDAYKILSRTYLEAPKQAILDWTDIVSNRMRKGESMERAVYFANKVFNITWEKEFEALNRDLENSMKGIKCTTHQNGSEVCTSSVNYESRRSPFFGASISAQDMYRQGTNSNDAAKYVKVICVASYPSLGTKVILDTYPSDGLFIPSFNIYVGDSAQHTRSAVAILIPKNIFADAGEIDCTLMARNVNFRDSPGGNLRFMFTYMP